MFIDGKFCVNTKMCESCIYKPTSPLSLKKLENDIKNKYGFFDGFRVCHNTKNSCCRGFWNKHKNNFQAGQIAARLKLIKYRRGDHLEKPLILEFHQMLRPDHTF